MEGRPQPQLRDLGASAQPVFAGILCAIDGREAGFTAVEQAAALAGPSGQLELVNHALQASGSRSTCAWPFRGES